MAETLIPTYIDPLKKLGTNPDRLADYLCDTLANYDPIQKEVVEAEVQPVYQWAKEGFDISQKPKRQNGKFTINHSIEVALIQACAGITDVQSAQTAITHDIFEDLKLRKYKSWKRIGEMTDSVVVTRDKLLTKVRRAGRQEIRVGGGGSKQKWVDEQYTQERLLKALKKDPLAIFTKLADVDRNQAEPLSDARRIPKAQVALRLYAPLALELGWNEVGRRTQDNAFRTLRPAEATKIERQQQQLVGANVIRRISQHVSEWAEYGEDGRPKMPLVSIAISTPTTYEIYKRSKESQESGDAYLPDVTIVCQKTADIDRWYRRLAVLHPLSEEEKKQNPFQDPECMYRSIPLYSKGKLQHFNVSIVTQDSLIMPMHLFVEGAGSLLPHQRKIAQRKLDLLTRSYELAVWERRPLGYVTGQVREFIDRGIIHFRAKDKTAYPLPVGATFLDAAYQLGPNLGNGATDVNVHRGNDLLELPLTARIEEGDSITIVVDNPTVDPTRYDMVTTTKARKDIKQAILEQSDNSHIQKKAWHRGIDVVSWLYQKKTGHEKDINIDYGFYEQLQKKYASLDELITAVGYLPVPCREDAYAEWDPDRWEPEDDLEEREISVMRDAQQMAHNLIDYRARCPTIVIRLVDAIGITARIASVTAKNNVNIITNTSIGDDHASYYEGNEVQRGKEIRMLCEPADPKTIETIARQIQRTIREADVQIVWGTNQEEDDETLLY